MVTTRRVVTATYGQDDPAEQAVPQVSTQPAECTPVEHHLPRQVELQRFHCGPGQAPLMGGTIVVLASRSDVGDRRASTQARAFEAKIDIRRILDPSHAACLKRCRQTRARHREKRAQHSYFRALDEGGHAGKAIGSALARRPHRHGFRLVVGMMGNEQMQDAAPMALTAQQLISGGTRRRLKTTLWLWPAPTKHDRLDPKPTQQVARQRCFVGRSGAQSMIDDQGDDPPTADHSPIMREQDQRKRIATARHRYPKHRTTLERLETGHQAREYVTIDASGISRTQLHPSFWRSCSIRRFCRSVARG